MIICTISKFILLVPIDRILPQLTLQPNHTAKSRARPACLISIPHRRRRLADIIIIGIKSFIIYLFRAILLSNTSIFGYYIVHFLNYFYLFWTRLFLRVEYFDMNFIFVIIVADTFQWTRVTTEVYVFLWVWPEIIVFAHVWVCYSC